MDWCDVIKFCKRLWRSLSRVNANTLIAFSMLVVAAANVWIVAKFSQTQNELIAEGQKPRIGVVETATKAPPKAGRDFIVETTIMNTGNGPASKWGFQMKPQVQIKKSDENLDCSIDRPTEVGTFMPGQEFTIETRLRITKDLMKRIRKGEDLLYVVGRTDYSDRAGARHCLQICMSYRGNGLRFGFGGPNGHVLKSGKECEK